MWFVHHSLHSHLSAVRLNERVLSPTQLHAHRLPSWGTSPQAECFLGPRSHGLVFWEPLHLTALTMAGQKSTQDTCQNEQTSFRTRAETITSTESALIPFGKEQLCVKSFYLPRRMQPTLFTNLIWRQACLRTRSSPFHCWSLPSVPSSASGHPCSTWHETKWNPFWKTQRPL